MRQARAYPNHRRLRQVSYCPAKQDLHIFSMSTMSRINKVLKHFLTVVIQSILSPFSGDNAQEHAAQVMRAKNRVAQVLKHSLRTNGVLDRVQEKKKPCTPPSSVGRALNYLQPSCSASRVWKTLFALIIRALRTCNLLPRGRCVGFEIKK